MNTRRYPRTMESAFGPYQRSSQCDIVPLPSARSEHRANTYSDFVADKVARPVWEQARPGECPPKRVYAPVIPEIEDNAVADFAVLVLGVLAVCIVIAGFIAWKVFK
jgi:hypothetical protein